MTFNSEDFHRFWLPWTDMDNYLDDWGSTVFTKSEGNLLIDSCGNKYLDLSSGLWNVCLGYSNDLIKKSIIKQLHELPFVSSAGYSNEPALLLSKKIFEITGYSHVFYASSGSEAVETAMKIARLHWYNQGLDKKVNFISLSNSYHGSTFGALSLCGVMEDRIGFGPLLKECYQFDFPDIETNSVDNTSENYFAEEFEKYVIETGSETIAAFIAEPIQGSGGIRTPPPNFFKGIKKVCEEYDILFISDEIATGIGRTGKWLSLDHYDTKADIVCLGKGITSGYAPLSAVICKDKIYDKFRTKLLKSNKFLNHGFTSTGNPIGCTAALSTISFIEENKILDHVNYLGKEIEKNLIQIKSNNKIVKKIDGKGLFWGIWLDDEPCRYNKSFNLVQMICYIAKRKGLLLYPTSRNCITIVPSFTMTFSELTESMEILNKIIGMVR